MCLLPAQNVVFYVKTHYLKYILCILYGDSFRQLQFLVLKTFQYLQTCLAILIYSSRDVTTGLSIQNFLMYHLNGVLKSLQSISL